MGVFKTIFKDVAEDSIFITRWREIQGRPVPGVQEREALQQLNRLQTSLSNTKHEIVRQQPLRQTAVEQNLFTIQNTFNQLAEPYNMPARGLEMALWLGNGTSLLAAYETSIPEIDVVAEQVKRLQKQITGGVKLRDVKKDLNAVNDAAFDITLRFARVQEATKSAMRVQQVPSEAEAFVPFGYSRRAKFFGHS